MSECSESNPSLENSSETYTHKSEETSKTKSVYIVQDGESQAQTTTNRKISESNSTYNDEKIDEEVKSESEIYESG